MVVLGWLCVVLSMWVVSFFICCFLCECEVWWWFDL